MYKKTGGYICMLVSGEFPLAATCSEKEWTRMNFFYGNTNWIVLAVFLLRIPRYSGKVLTNEEKNYKAIAKRYLLQTDATNFFRCSLVLFPYSFLNFSS